MKSPDVILLHPDDNVCVAARNLARGAAITLSDGTLTPAPSITLRARLSQKEREQIALAEPVRQGHKIAIAEIAVGKPIVKYGQIIGFASQKISPGQWVHSQNVDAGAFERDYAKSTDVPPQPTPLAGYTFQGYRRADGRVGTRNYVAIISSVNCSASVSKYIARRFDAAALRDYPNVDGVVAFSFGGGCGIPFGDEYHQILTRVLGGMARHPNIGGYVLIGLGCESNTIGHLIEDQKLVQINGQAQGLQPLGLQHTASRPPVLVMQDLGGTAKTIEAEYEVPFQGHTSFAGAHATGLHRPRSIEVDLVLQNLLDDHGHLVRTARIDQGPRARRMAGLCRHLCLGALFAADADQSRQRQEPPRRLALEVAGYGDQAGQSESRPDARQ
jgi:altronate hydrolase